MAGFANLVTEVGLANRAVGLRLRIACGRRCAAMILVIGATGVLGQKVVRLLLAEGHRVRAMTRVAERAK